MKREYGYNLAGLRVVGRRIREAESGGGFVDDSVEEKGGVKGKKRGFVSVA